MIISAIENFYDAAATANVPTAVIEQFNDAVSDWIAAITETETPLPKYMFERSITSSIVQPQVITQIETVKHNRAELVRTMRDVWIEINNGSMGDAEEAAIYMLGDIHK